MEYLNCTFLRILIKKEAILKNVNERWLLDEHLCADYRFTKWMANDINFDTARINAKVVRRNCKEIVLSKCLDKKAKQRSRKVSKLPFMWVT